jgi:hypothetical protein
MQNKMKLKINRFSEELPADADETNVTRQVKNACFLMLRLKFHQIQSSTFFERKLQHPWYFHRRHKIQ